MERFPATHRFIAAAKQMSLLWYVPIVQTALHISFSSYSITIHCYKYNIFFSTTVNVKSNKKLERITTLCASNQFTHIPNVPPECFRLQRFQCCLEKDQAKALQPTRHNHRFIPKHKYSPHSPSNAYQALVNPSYWRRQWDKTQIFLTCLALSIIISIDAAQFTETHVSLQDVDTNSVHALNPTASAIPWFLLALMSPDTSPRSTLSNRLARSSREQQTRIRDCWDHLGKAQNVRLKIHLNTCVNKHFHTYNDKPSGSNRYYLIEQRNY